MEMAYKNWDLVKHTKLTLRVRIGRKTMMLQDVKNFDLGSVIETDQMSNRPIELLLGDTLVAYGEAVIVDGNFGIQVTKMIKAVKK